MSLGSSSGRASKCGGAAGIAGADWENGGGDG